MNKPETFQLVLQPPRSFVCGAAVCAMALGKTLDQVLEETDWRKLTHLSGIAQYLAAHNVTTGCYFPKLDPDMVGSTA